jgi:hypothetical protein
MSWRGLQRGGLSLPRLVCYPTRVDPTPCGGHALGRPSPMLDAFRLLSPARPSATPQFWVWQQPASVTHQAVRGSPEGVCTRVGQNPLTLV